MKQSWFFTITSALVEISPQFTGKAVKIFQFYNEFPLDTRFSPMSPDS